MVGILCEKPSAARNFAKALGGKETASKSGVKNYIGNFNGEDFVIVHARGHLYGLPKDPKFAVKEDKASRYAYWDLQYLPWDIADFTWPYFENPDVKPLPMNIKTTLSKCDEIVIATDNDPTGEGDLLAGEILICLGLAKQRLSRMYFTDEAVPSLQKGFKARKAVPNLYTLPEFKKGLFRQRFDFLTMQISRIAKILGDGETITRQGRLKSVMVEAIGKQIEAYNSYKKIPFYENCFRDENGVLYSRQGDKKELFAKETDVPEYGKILKSPVVKDSATMKRQAPPKLYDMSALAGVLAPEGYSAEMVQSVYQKMYDAQIVSYPRTEDKEITPEQFTEMLGIADRIADAVHVDKSLLTHRTARSTHVKNGGSHGANRPGSNVPRDVEDLAGAYGTLGVRIYDLLAHSFLAMLCEDYEYESQVGHVKDYPDYIGSTTVPKKLGYRAIFTDDDVLMDDSKGLGTNAESFIKENFPPRPAYPTVRWLMSYLEKNGVGTGATRVSTYAMVCLKPKDSKSKSQPMLKEAKGKIYLTAEGELSYALLIGTKIGDVVTTKELQDDMNAVANGTLDFNTGLLRVAEIVKFDMEVMRKNGEAYRNKHNITLKKGNTNMGMYPEVKKVKGFYAPFGKEMEIKATWGANDKWLGHTFTQAELDALFEGKSVTFKAVSKAGKQYDAEMELATFEYNGKECFGPQFVNRNK